MAATLASPIVDCSPGNAIVLSGSGLTPGVPATVQLANQGLVVPAPLTISASFASLGGSVSFTVPDGITSDTLTVTAGDGSTATCALQVDAQYMQAAQFIGEGFDTSGLANGVLDNVLRDASAQIDSYIGYTLRYLQTTEDHRFRESRKIWPLRRPLVSLDALAFITSNALTTKFNVSGAAPDVYVNKNSNYFDVQAYAVGNAILLGAIQTIGFSANVWKAIYTAGYTVAITPRNLRKATAIIAVELLSYANIQAQGLGGLSRVRQGSQQYDRRNEQFAIPQPALDLLRPFIDRHIR